MLENSTNNRRMLDRAQAWAMTYSTCCKVQVGSVIITTDLTPFYGCNRGIERDCSAEGCLRIEKYGNDSKNHRLPSDCVSVHSEVDAIGKAAAEGVSLAGAKIFITRYPCEACARAIVTSGIKTVIYGRKEEVSEMSSKIFKAGKVSVYHFENWDYQDNNS